MGVKEKHKVENDGKRKQRKIIITCELSLRISLAIEKTKIKMQLLTPQITIVNNSVCTIKITKIWEVDNAILQQKYLTKSKKIKRNKKMLIIIPINID